MSLYVQRDIPVPLARLWELTQNPAQHQRWDLRFSEIRYLPRQRPTDLQSFTYETRLGFGLVIRGTGTTCGERQSAGASTSALVFGSDSSLSLIRKGSGYWQYVPTKHGVRFVTVYDYDVRWGWFGWLLDRAVFRPLMAWATAWSFDRLARWAHRGMTPERSLRVTAAYALARLTLAVMWIYQGLVPKLLGPHPKEMSMTLRIGLSTSAALQMVTAAGYAEILIGLLILLRWRDRWPAFFTLFSMPVAFAVALLSGPEVLREPFSVTIFNGMAMTLAAIVLLLQSESISAANCRWSAHRRARLSRLFM